VGFRYVGILTPIWAIASFQLFKGVFAGMSVLLLVSVVLPGSVSVKIARVGLGVIGMLLIGINLLSILNPKTRSFVPTLRSLWSINGMFLGTLVALAIYLWLEFQRDRVSSK
jgi:hypothetical protein